MSETTVLDRVPESVRADLERLQEDWGEFEVRETIEEYPEADDVEDDEGFGDDGVFRYASTWIRRDGEVLLVRPADDDGWTGPGGRREPGERLAETARREVREEAGVECRLVGVIEANVSLVTFGDRATVPAFGVVFDAEYTAGSPRPEPGEIDDVRWFPEVPDEKDLVFPRAADYPL